MGEKIWSLDRNMMLSPGPTSTKDIFFQKKRSLDAMENSWWMLVVSTPKNYSQFKDHRPK